MKLLITGIAGFVGSTISRMFLENYKGIDIVGVDNFLLDMRKELLIF
ncbi:hypothetical protein WNA58_002744 [Vibrio cholerae]|nr:hypothetical protein [Vibrio cholerae]EJL6293304.1 hypothetical protein [Vibrio cholerae]EKI0759089.1 hypothetical protein [Vibrio cholerae]BCN20524.1 putative monosaccharide biosynthesis protein [Vibrio cholerae]